MIETPVLPQAWRKSHYKGFGSLYLDPSSFGLLEIKQAKPPCQDTFYFKIIPGGRNQGRPFVRAPSGGGMQSFSGQRPLC